MTGKSKEEQIQMENELRPYYKMGLSAWDASQRTGHSYNTCRKYWDVFHDQVIEEEEKDIAIRQREVIAQFKTSYGEVTFNLNAQLNEIIGLKQSHKKKWNDELEKLRKNGTKSDDLPLYKPDKFLEDKFTEINKILTDVAEKRANALIAPYIDEETESSTLKRLQDRIREEKDKHGKLGK